MKAEISWLDDPRIFGSTSYQHTAITVVTPRPLKLLKQRAVWFRASMVVGVLLSPRIPSTGQWASMNPITTGRTLIG